MKWNYSFSFMNGILSLSFPRLAKKQIETLKRMVAFVRDECLTTEVAQVRAKTKALNHWKIPEKIPIPANIRTADSACKDILLELPLSECFISDYVKHSCGPILY